MVSYFIDEFSGYLRLSNTEVEKAEDCNVTVPKGASQIIEFGVNRDG